MHRLDKLFPVESIFIYIFQPPEATEPPFLETFAQPLAKNISVSKSPSYSCSVQNQVNMCECCHMSTRC